MRQNKENHFFFSKLLRWEKTASADPAFLAGIETDFRVIFGESHKVPVVERVAVALVGSAYQHFGFVIFGPLGRSLLSAELNRLSGLQQLEVMRWLEIVAFSLLEDLNVLQVVTGEPDWYQVDASLALDLWKRLFCSDEVESAALGLDCLDSQEIGRLRVMAAAAVSRLTTDPATVAFSPSRAQEYRDIGDCFVSTYRLVSDLAASNPLMLLLWRIEVFSLLMETRHEQKFRIKRESSEILPVLSALAGVLLILSPVADVQSKPIFPESPLSLEEIRTQLGERNTRSRGAASTPHSERVELLREWVGPYGLENLNEVLTLGLSYGLIFRVEPRAGKLAYGLTSAGRQTLRPFLNILGELLCSGEREALASLLTKESGIEESYEKNNPPSREMLSKNKTAMDGAGAQGFMTELSADLHELAERSPLGARRGKGPRTRASKGH